MEAPLLKEPHIVPTKEVLAKVLGKSYAAFDSLISTITQPEYGLEPQWNYYNDGKAWLCKVQYKKKTVFWLSVWDKYFKTGFYFTDKNSAGIYDLDIDNEIKKNFKNSKHIGKLIPLGISVSKKDQLKDVLKVIEYKKGLK
jgi:hypothetical protein